MTVLVVGGGVCRRAQQLLGWRAQHTDIRTIVEDAWRWHRRLRAA